MKYLNENGVKSSRVHERNDLHTCTQQYKSYLPGVDKAVKSMLCIPVGYWVDQESREYIVDLIKKGW
jgi:dTDP-4-amino-4,6-dideoxygalactose transaminase